MGGLPLRVHARGRGVPLAFAHRTGRRGRLHQDLLPRTLDHPRGTGSVALGAPRGQPHGRRRRRGGATGGYGYNFRYLGNARPTPTFHARLGREVRDEAGTIAVGDTAGSRNGVGSAEPGDGGAAVYALDAPVAPAAGEHGRSGVVGDPNPYYESGPVENVVGYDPDHRYLTRSAPATRNQGGVAGFDFLDGHAVMEEPEAIDDPDGDGTADNASFDG